MTEKRLKSSSGGHHDTSFALGIRAGFVELPYDCIESKKIPLVFAVTFPPLISIEGRKERGEGVRFSPFLLFFEFPLSLSLHLFSLSLPVILFWGRRKGWGRRGRKKRGEEERERGEREEGGRKREG